MYSHSTTNEKLLLIKVAGGDENAFAQLFQIYNNHLGEFIMRITESEPLAQEIVQDVFLKVWLNRSCLSEIACFKAYLLVVARNHAFNCLKQIAREQSRKKEWVNAVLYQAVDSVNDNNDVDTCMLLDEAVELLPLQQKKVYTLSRTNGIRQDEIARQLNISHQTVKKHMVLALRFLKNHLRTRMNLVVFLLSNLIYY